MLDTYSFLPIFVFYIFAIGNPCITLIRLRVGIILYAHVCNVILINVTSFFRQRMLRYNYYVVIIIIIRMKVLFTETRR
jgi:hypothetical protein